MTLDQFGYIWLGIFAALGLWSGLAYCIDIVPAFKPER